MQQIMQPVETDPAWESIAPLLDQAMARLRQSETNALLLRYFQDKSLKEVGAALGLSEDAAQKRISRSIVKLREILARNGTAPAASVITGALATHAAKVVAPAQLSATITATGFASSASSPSIYPLVDKTLHHLLWTKARAAAAVAVAPLLVTGLLVVHHLHHPADSGNVRISLQGTPGLKFELVRTEAGQTHTNSGVVPGIIRFDADAFTADLRVEGAGTFSFNISRDNPSGSPTTGFSSGRAPALISMELAGGGRGIRISSKISNLKGSL